MIFKKQIISAFLLAMLLVSFVSCLPKEDTLPNITGIDNSSVFKIDNYDENGLNSTSQFANAKIQFGISEILQITIPGSVFQGKWKIENGKIIIKDVLAAPFTKLNNTWTWSVNNAFNIVASAQNGASVSNIGFTKLQ
jgi:hypothetical protein